MTDLEDLIAAAGPAPSAGLLRIVVSTAAVSEDVVPAIVYVGGLEPGRFDVATRLAVAGFLVADGEAPGSASRPALQAALLWTGREEGALALLRARALLALGHPDEARQTYVASLALFPQLRDSDLDARLARAQGQAASGDEAPATETSNVVPLDPRGRRAPAAAGPDAAAEPERERIDFSSIGGLEDVKTQIRRRIILPFEKKGLFDRFRKRAGGGVLLYGPPGCGKTLLARATAEECGASFTAVAITDVLDKWIGESEKRVAELFAGARGRRPAVLFFDEVEALATRRRFSENSFQASMVSTFLNEMDGFNDNNEGVLVLAATNTPWAIDSAFRRPGRFDRSLFVPPPDRTAREAILKLALKDRPSAPALPLGEIADKTSGFSGADLSHLVETACDLAIERSIEIDSIAPITGADLKAALKTVRPTTAEWLTQARNYTQFANEGGFYDDVAEFLKKHGR